MKGSGLVTFALLSALAGAAAAQQPAELPSAPPSEDGAEPPPEGEARGAEEIPEAPPGTAAEALPPPPPRETIDPELLALCESVDVAARRYCLRRIDEAGQPSPEVRATLMRMSSRDPELHRRARDAFRRLFAAEPPPYQAIDEERPPEAPTEPEVPPGDPYRVVYAPTAWVRPAGTAAFNAFELGTFQVDFGIDDHVQLGFQTMIPVGVIGIGAVARAGWQFEGGAVGVNGNAVALVPFVDGGEDPIFLYGGGPTVTLGDFDRYVNAGVAVYGLSSSDDDVAAVVPHIGGSLKLAARLKVNAELYGITTTDGGVDFGELFLLMWGVRIFGDSLWGDIALIDPICEDCGEIYEVIPLGIPFLNVGASW